MFSERRVVNGGERSWVTRLPPLSILAILVFAIVSQTAAAPAGANTLSPSVHGMYTPADEQRFWTATMSACLGNPAGRKLLLVSLDDQQMWACDGPALAGASAITSGAYALPNVHDATPTGTWQISAKVTNTYLTGCDNNGCWDDYVHYWMPFDGGYGFHDAPWQSFPFGSAVYATGGSHGCVHLPEDEAAWVFNWASVGTTVSIRTR
jgi:L,D-transpeptidase catalytic domain